MISGNENPPAARIFSPARYSTFVAIENINGMTIICWFHYPLYSLAHTSLQQKKDTTTTTK